MHIADFLQRIAYSIRNDRRYQYYDQFKKHLSFSRIEMIDHQNELITKIIKHAYSATDYYREIMDEHKLKPDEIHNKEDLKKLPILTKSIVRNNIENIKSKDNFSKGLKVVTSGGSTGDQSMIFKSAFFDQISRAAFLRNNLLANWKPYDKTVWIWGAPYEHQQIQASIISRIGILINRRLLLNAYNYSCNDFTIWIDKINRFKPRVLYGYASIILEFARYLLEHQIELASIKTVVSTTEGLKDREIIERAFRCNVYNQYGSREMLAIAIESDRNCMRVADDFVALNVYDNNEMIITALYSYGFPLINYKIGDYGELKDNSVVQDNLPFSSLELTIGRITDNFLTINDRIVSSSALGTYISTHNLPIMEQQIIQNDYKDFVVNFVPDKSLDISSYKQIITSIFTEYFGPENHIQFNLVNEIPVEKSGKKLMFKRVFGY